MEFSGFDWDQANRHKCQKRGVSIVEIEGLFEQVVSIAPDPRHSIHEERFKADGSTEAGRKVFVAFTLRRRGDETFIRPVSARYMHRRRSNSMKKKLPTLASDEEAEAFVANADLSEYDLSEMVPMRFELKPKDKSVNLRLPEQLLEAVRSRAARAGVPYQRFIRMALERALQERK
jgi:predicted DNA binding CopG/RHH family protein